MSLVQGTTIVNNQSGGVRVVGGVLFTDAVTVQGNGAAGIHLFETTEPFGKSTLLSSTGFPGNGLFVDTGSITVEGAVIGSHGGNGIHAINSGVTVQVAVGGTSEEPIASEILNNSERGIWTEGGGTLTVVGGTFQGNGLSNIESVGALVSVTDVHTFGGVGGERSRDCINLVRTRIVCGRKSDRRQCRLGDSCGLPPGHTLSGNDPIRFNDLGGIRVLSSNVTIATNGDISGNSGPGIQLEQATGFVSNNSVFDTEGRGNCNPQRGKYRGDREHGQWVGSCRNRCGKQHKL